MRWSWSRSPTEDENTDSSLSAETKLTSAEAELELSRLRSSYPRLVLQLIAMEEVPSHAAVRMVAAQTLRARETGCLLAEKAEVDLLLRLAGTNQIADAMRRSGYRAKGKKILVAVGPRPDLSRLRLELEDLPAYRLRENGRMSERDLTLVETAALLGTGS